MMNSHRCARGALLALSVASALWVGCEQRGGPGPDAGADGAARADATAAADAGDAGAPADAGPDAAAPAVPTTESAFGIFAGFTREFLDYEQAAGMSHAEYLAWAGQQYQALGAAFTRSNLQLVWDRIEPTLGGAYDWENELGTEEAFGAAAAAGVHYLAVFHEGGYLDADLRRPDQYPADYARFVRDVVERFDGDGVGDAPGAIRIQHWQVGNESPLFEAMSDGVQTYVTWFTLTAEAIRQADPEASVLLTADTDSQDVSSFHREVLTRLAESGVRVDALDIHHWGSAEEIDIAAVSAYQSLLSSLGLPDVQIWSTEHSTWVGQPAPPEGTCTPACASTQICAQGGPGPARCVARCADDSSCPQPTQRCDVASGWCLDPAQTEADQARSLVKRYVVNRDHGVAKIFWNNLVSWHDFGGRTGGAYDRMGLVADGFLAPETPADVGRPRLAWYAYRDLSARTDTLIAEPLGPVETADATAYVSAYRNRSSGRVGWVAWSGAEATMITYPVSDAGAHVVGFVYDPDTLSPVRDQIILACHGSASIPVDPDPVWIEPLP